MKKKRVIEMLWVIKKGLLDLKIPKSDFLFTEEYGDPYFRQRCRYVGIYPFLFSLLFQFSVTLRKIYGCLSSFVIGKLQNF